MAIAAVSLPPNLNSGHEKVDCFLTLHQHGSDSFHQLRFFEEWWLPYHQQKLFQTLSKAICYTGMKWNHLTKAEDLTNLVERSHQTPQVIFKHSTRCSISSMAKNRLESADTPAGIDFHYLDLIAYRDLSNKIAADFHVHHESPQVLLIQDGECIYDESHMGISMSELEEQATKK